MKGVSHSSRQQEVPSLLISNPTVEGALSNIWQVPLAGFANPKYIDEAPDKTTGFDITDCLGVSICIDGGPTFSFTAEQTNDPDGVTGWFAVIGRAVSSPISSNIAVTTAAIAYFFGAFGLRMRFRATSLTVADLNARVVKLYDAVDVSTAALTIAAGTASIGAVSSPLAEDAAIGAAGTQGLLQALEARSAQKTGMTASGDKVNAQATMDGKLTVQPYAIPELTFAYASPTAGIVSSTADVILKAAAGATIRNYLDNLSLAHDLLSAATEFVIKDGATVIFRGKLQTPASEGLPGCLTFSPPLRSSLNAALNFALITSVTGGVFVNANGHTGL